MFTLAISCLTTSNLFWFMDPTFQVPMQYCSLQHQTLLPSITSTTGYCFCLGSISSFFLELFLHWSPVAYWRPTDLGSLPFNVLSFCLSCCSWGSQGKNTEVVCHSLLQWTTFCQNVGPPKTGGLWWRGLTQCGPPEKGMANHFSILALRTPWTVWKGKKIRHWKGNFIGAQYATENQWRNNSRKNEGMEPKQKQYPVVDVTGDRKML